MPNSPRALAEEVVAIDRAGTPTVGGFGYEGVVAIRTAAPVVAQAFLSTIQRLERWRDHETDPETKSRLGAIIRAALTAAEEVTP